MDTPRNFRTAFHGFNREDVVHYLEYINAKHSSQVNQLTAEAEELRARQAPESADLQPELDALQEKYDALAAQLEELTRENEQLRTQLEDALTAPAEAVPVELESYRQAERVQRDAKARAELVYYQVNGVLNDASAKVENAAAEITELADSVMHQLTQLQMAVSDSKHTFQDAAAMIGAIRPNK